MIVCPVSALCSNFQLLNILQVNNAGVNFNMGSENSVENAEMVISTNYYGTKNMINHMIPLMRPSAAGARIINVSSRLGRLNGRRNVSFMLNSLSFSRQKVFLFLKHHQVGFH